MLGGFRGDLLRSGQHPVAVCAEEKMRLWMLIRDLFDTPLSRHDAWRHYWSERQAEDQRSGTLIMSRETYGSEAE